VARFFLDNNVSHALQALLTADQHTVTTSRAHGLAGRDDVAQLLAAVDLQAVLVTHDREDFLLLHGAWLALAARWQQAEEHHSIVILPQAKEPQLHRYLTEFDTSQRPTRNAYWRYRPSDGWTRR